MSSVDRWLYRQRSKSLQEQNERQLYIASIVFSVIVIFSTLIMVYLSRLPNPKSEPSQWGIDFRAEQAYKESGDPKDLINHSEVRKALRKR